jgi:hypothetical protein
MVESRGLVLEPLATSHLEAEEGTHWFLRSVRILLSLFLLGRGGRSRGSGDNGLRLRGGGCFLLSCCFFGNWLGCYKNIVYLENKGCLSLYNFLIVKE